MMRSMRLISFSVSLPSMKTMTLLALRSFAISSRLQNGLATASAKLFGPAVTLLTELTPSIFSTSCVSLWILLRYRGEEISLDDTVRITCDGEGKCCSIFLDWRTPGSLVAKKKFSSTTGLRSTKTATRTNNTTRIASISQCEPNGVSLSRMVRFIASANPHLTLSRLAAAPRANCQRNLNDFHRAFRQRPQKGAAVRLGHDPIIENDNDPLVRLRSDQTPHALSHF